MSLDLALQRISQIQAMIAPLHGGAALPPAPATAATAVASQPLATAALAGPGATTGVQPASFGNVLAGATGALSAKASSLMTPGQRAFAGQLAAETGLHPQVIASWMLAEQSSTAARSREAQGNHNWLNIGWTDSGTYGANAAVWSDPIAAAHATAGWLKGEDTVDGYGRASAGVQSILTTAGQAPEAQIAALQRSGWASSGYPDLPVLYRQIGG
ncbi:hypothetical protein [Conexibacter arvalis]|uniref:Uncharacterized protein n=1 Tax=Conexibacter arvalis TaxID=912552 RepID=A0A840I7A2_9ACTN|nr:hypothetical protein [Conexibacter arvalis]MBB4660776.1 hypothetical protein [Conexibacter arvalis]